MYYNWNQPLLEEIFYMATTGVVLGHVISKNGIEMDPKKIECISKLATPTSCRKVRFVLGHAGYYRRFIEKFSFISRPLHVLMQKEATFV